MSASGWPLIPALPPEEARRWVALGTRHTRTGWILSGLWLAAAVGGITLSWDAPVCSEQLPCPGSWAERLFLTVFLAHLWWLVRHPRLALWTTAALGGFLWLDPERSAYPVWFLTAEAGLVVASLLVCWQRTEGRWHQAALAERWSVQVPGIELPPRALRPRRLALAAGGCLLAALGTLMYLQVETDRHHERVLRAERVLGTVVEHREDELVLLVDVNGVQREVDTWDALGYPVGSEVTVLVDGTWDWLAAEPYDPFFTGTLVLLLALAALFLSEVAWRVRRDLALLRGPHPALRLEAWDGGNDTLLAAPGGPVWLGIFKHDLDRDAWSLADDDEGDDDPSGQDGAPATLHGALAYGRAPALVLDDLGASRMVWATGLLAPAPRDIELDGNGLTGEPDAAVVLAAPPVVPPWLATGTPVTFAVAAWARVARVGLLLGGVALHTWLSADREFGTFQVLFGFVPLAFGFADVALNLSWKATVDSVGMHLRHPLVHRTVRWEQIEEVVPDVLPSIFLHDGEDLVLHPVPPPPWLRAAGAPADRLAIAVAVMHQQPHLRPVDEVEALRPVCWPLLALGALATLSPPMAVLLTR